MLIVPATAADEPAIKRLLEACELPTEDIGAQLLQHFLVLREGTDLIGVVGLENAGKFALLRSLAVPRSARDKGIGDRMVVAAEAMARDCGVTALYLLTTTADRFFERLGYRRLPREEAPAVIRATSQFATLCPSTSVLMTKAL